CAVGWRWPASARRPTTSTASRRMRSSRSRSRRSCARAKTLGYLPARSMASRPTRTTATIPRAWRPPSACTSCAVPTCSGAGAAALVLVAAERARDLRQQGVYVLGVAQGSEHRNGAPVHNAPLYATSSFTTVAPHLYASAGVTPGDVDVVQSYENFTGGVLMSLVE